MRPTKSMPGGFMSPGEWRYNSDYVEWKCHCGHCAGCLRSDLAMWKVCSSCAKPLVFEDMDPQRIARILAWYVGLRADLITVGGQEEIDWANNVSPPVEAISFARECIFVICNSGMKAQVAKPIFDRVMVELQAGRSANGAFGHKLKAAGIDQVWQSRDRLFTRYCDAVDKLAFLVTLPFIGDITKFHLAKNFGIQCAKPDRHLDRIAKILGMEPQSLCELIAARHDDSVACVDLVIWRACNLNLIDSDGEALDEESLLNRRRAWVAGT